MPSDSGYEECTSLEQVVALLESFGASRIYAKVLAANDNSKNQIYLGGDLGVSNIIPSGDPEPATGSHGEPIFKAQVEGEWVSARGARATCDWAQLILYPQYPEVRFSGFLRGCSLAPSELMRPRLPGRVLFLGIRQDRRVLMHVVGAENPLAAEVQHASLVARGVLLEIPGTQRGGLVARGLLLAELCRIARRGWIDSKRLNRDGEEVRCEAENCGGYTLEAELGITPNGYSEPDFHGWEVKQHAVGSFERPTIGPLTLMTPEPTGGIYHEDGLESFLRRFGYPDSTIPGRINFGGIHKVGVRCQRTGCELHIVGFENGVITNSGGSLELKASDGDVAASWSFSALLQIWTRKHAQAVYVGSMRRTEPRRQYRYRAQVDLGVDTDFQRFLAAAARGDVYYDPGIHIVNTAGRVVPRKRSQFRIKSSRLPDLYRSFERVDACA